MVGGRGHRKSLGKNYSSICVNMQIIPNPTIISLQQGGTPTNIETLTQSTSPTMSETHPATYNDSHLIGQGLSTRSNIPKGHTNTVAEGESNSSHPRTLVFLTSSELVYSFNLFSTCCVDDTFCL